MIENNRYYWSHLKTKTVTVRVKQQDEQVGVVFRVSNMIDIGNGKQTVVLEHVAMAGAVGRRSQKEAMAIPFRMGSLDFIYTSRQNPIPQNVDGLLALICRDQKVERIVPEVVAPGDLLIFRQNSKTMKIKMIDALRIVKENTYIQSKAGHAL